MIDRIWTSHLGLATICFGAVGTAIYYVMIAVVDPHAPPNSGCYRPIKVVTKKVLSERLFPECSAYMD